MCYCYFISQTHYPFELLPPKLLDTCKVIFVCRNVKVGQYKSYQSPVVRIQDACVSYYHHHLLMKHIAFDSPFPVFARDLYMRSNILQGGYFEMLRSGWKRKENPNLLFFWYEDMKQDQGYWIRRIMDHIGYSMEEEKE